MKKAFSLAEVLIILGVIGFVTALTLPILITNYQKTLVVNKLKLEYSKFASIITQSVSDNGNVSDWIAELEDAPSLTEKSRLLTEKYILPYIDGGGTTFKPYEYGNVWSIGKKATFFHYYVTGKAYRIKNGTIFRISIYGDELIVLLDIDNKIKDNIVGKDVFSFVINPSNNRLEPVGSKLSRDILTGKDKDRWCFSPECEGTTWLAGWQACNKANQNTYGGYFCTALIIKDGWKMSEDYPW